MIIVMESKLQYVAVRGMTSTLLNVQLTFKKPTAHIFQSNKLPFVRVGKYVYSNTVLCSSHLLDSLNSLHLKKKRED